MKQFNLSNWFAQYRNARIDARVRRYATLDERWGLPIWEWLLLLLTIGAGVRFVAYLYATGFFHADEIGQYLEPAHRLLEHHGVVAWEFKDGGRNWFVAWHYAAVLKFAHWFGLSGLGQFQFARLHAAMLSLVVIPAAFRIGRALTNRWEGAVLAGAIVALSPTLGFFRVVLSRKVTVCRSSLGRKRYGVNKQLANAIVRRVIGWSVLASYWERQSWPGRTTGSSYR